MFQIQEAIKKNICSPTDDELDDFTISRSIRASVKAEGDSQLGLLLFVGVCNDYGYRFLDVSAVVTMEREEYNFKLSKYKNKSHSTDNSDKRFKNKIKLIKNYLRLQYGAKVF